VKTTFHTGRKFFYPSNRRLLFICGAVAVASKQKHFLFLSSRCHRRRSRMATAIDLLGQCNQLLFRAPPRDNTSTGDPTAMVLA
jgi:hypothetical protein